MFKHLYLLLFLPLIGHNAFSQKLAITPSVVDFHTVTTGNTDSIQVIFSIVNNSGNEDTVIVVKDIDSYHKAFFCKDTAFTVTPSQPVLVWIRFAPVHNINHLSYLMVTSTARNPAAAFRVKGTGTHADLYYSATQNLSEEALKSALKTIITTGHNGLGYNGARDKMFMEIDNKKTNGQGASVNTLECVYTGRIITGYVDRTEAQNATNNFNTEHTWPQSLFDQNEPMRGDLNHLFPTDEVPNGIRSNYPFGMVSNPTWTSGGSKYASGVFEPRDVHKGEVARALMYFVLRYEDYGNFFAPQETNLRDWHGKFGPTPIERKRNDDVKAAQGNKNPFIDHPEFAERITLLAGNSVAPARTTIGYSHSPAEIRGYYPGDVPSGNDISFDFVNTGNTLINYSASFAQDRFLIMGTNKIGSIPVDSTLSLVYELRPTIDSVVYDTLIVNSNVTNAPAIRIPVKVTIPPYIGINEITSGKFTFQLFPNPSNNELNILSQTADEYDVFITNLQGQQMLCTKGNNRLKLNTGDLPDGVYFVSIKNERSVHQTKIIIQH